MDSNPVTATLTQDEALVLFEFLARNEEADNFPVADEAEERVLWRLHGQLEKQIAEVFDPNYHELVRQARARLRDPS